MFCVTPLARTGWAVEEILNPSLKDKPVIVVARPEQRVVGALTSYAARAFRIRSAIATALNLPNHKRGQVVNLAMVGNVMLECYVGHIMAKRGTGYPFTPVRDLVTEADVAFAGLELLLTTAEKVGQDCDLQPEPSAVQGLAKAGFDVVSLANHCTDYSGEHTCPHFHKPDGGDSI